MTDIVAGADELRAEIERLRSRAKLYENLLTQAIFYGVSPQWQDEARTLLDLRAPRSPDGS